MIDFIFFMNLNIQFFFLNQRIERRVQNLVKIFCDIYCFVLKFGLGDDTPFEKENKNILKKK